MSLMTARDDLAEVIKRADPQPQPSAVTARYAYLRMADAVIAAGWTPPQLTVEPTPIVTFDDACEALAAANRRHQAVLDQVEEYATATRLRRGCAAIKS